jgi:hypothetical protein
MVSGSGVWRNCWFGRFTISGRNVYVCGCMLYGGRHVSTQFVVQNRCDAILSAFLMVGVILLWYCLNSLLFMRVVLFGSVNCSSEVMFSSNSWCIIYDLCLV